VEGATQAIVALADDLTGAAACAGELGAAIVPWRSAGRSRAGARAVVDCASRALTASSAAGRLTDVLGSLERTGTQRLYKRIDSRLRGNVAPELAVLARRGMPLLLAPAAPSLGVTTVGGVQLAAGEPVDRAPRHGEPGPGSSRLATLLPGEAAELSLGEVRSDGLRALISSALASGQSIVCDAETAGDLEAIGRAAASFPGCVPVGSYGLAAPWGAALDGRDRARGVLVVVGSPRPETRAQVDMLSVAGVTGCLRSEAGARLRAGQDVLLEDAPAGEGPGGALRVVLGSVRPAGLVLVGGELASDAVRACGAESAVVVGEPWPATAVLRLEGGLVDGIPAIVKSGALGGPDRLVEAIALLRTLTAGER
jgi:4-hydroxythreonine-4-phosphate dehydrogenase